MGIDTAALQTRLKDGRQPVANWYAMRHLATGLWFNVENSQGRAYYRTSATTPTIRTKSTALSASKLVINYNNLPIFPHIG